MELPRFVVLKSEHNKKYLRYIHEDVQVHGFLEFSGEEVVSPFAKYQVEKAKGANNLVHIKCCYNNKYWRRWTENHYWIAAIADEAEEDRSQWSCTLFEPIYVDSGDHKKGIRFRHAQLGHYAFLWRAAPPHSSCLFAGSESHDKHGCDVYTVIDWESLVRLPKHVAFKGNNGLYLVVRPISGNQYLQFSASDVGDESAGYEVFTMSDGSVRIKSIKEGKFWKCNNEWIRPNSSPDDDKKAAVGTLFWPTTVEEKVIALRNLGNNKFCKMHTESGKTNVLKACASNISNEAFLTVEEYVISRKIYEVQFRVMDARIYNQSTITLDRKQYTNNSEVSMTQDILLSYEDSQSITWNASVSLHLGVQANFQTGIPLISEGKIEISAETTATYEWGKLKKILTQKNTAYKVTLPPMTMVRVSLLATQSSCDVPFSYSQCDTLRTGQKITSNMDDGVCTGTNYFNLIYQIKEEKL